jgi:hypothetical protein
MIINWLNGLLREKLAILYQFEDSLYLEMSEWRKEQQIRNKYSKYPAPDTDGVILLSEIPSEAQNAPSETTKESAQENIPDTPKKLKEDKADDSPKPKKENTPYDEIVGEYNLILCQLLPKVVLVTEKRQKAMDKIWKVHSGDMELIKKVFAITSESDFLTGKKTNWKADFDFIMKPQNFVKILEGSYNNSSEFPPQTPKGGTHIPNAFAGLHEFGCED